MVGPHEFQPLSWITSLFRYRGKCARCYLSREAHPTGWTTARPLGDTSPANDTDWHASPALVEQLQQLGSQYGPLGVAIAAARLTDRDALLARLDR
jgi:hypothetical protein